MTPEELRELFVYDPNTGSLTNKIFRNPNAKAGATAGAVFQHGYIVVNVRGKKLYAHRIVFAMMTGRWPDGTIDHIDRNRANLKWSNLREASQTENNANWAKQSGTTSKYKGVSWDSGRKKWFAKIQIGKKQIALGRYDSEDDAGAAYAKKADEIYGQFAHAPGIAA